MSEQMVIFIGMNVIIAAVLVIILLAALIDRIIRHRKGER